MTEKLQAWDLFCGTGSATKYFRRSPNWNVTQVDVKDAERINPDMQTDISELSAEDLPDPDFVWASPPCTTFSMASVRWYWDKMDGEYVPTKDDKEKAERARQHLNLVLHTLSLIDEADPEYWFMENPRALLRSLLKQKKNIEPSGTVTYCQFGDTKMKPTDLWGDHPDGFEYRSCSNGDRCHVSASRGTTHQGTQRSDIDAVERGRIPDELARHVFDAVNDVSEP